MTKEIYERRIEDCYCQNPQCQDYGKKNNMNLKFRGWTGGERKYRMVKCSTCGATFSERKGTVFQGSKISEEKVIDILRHVEEGCSARSTNRLTGSALNTVLRYIHVAGAHAKKTHDELVSFSPKHKRNSDG